MIDVESLTKAMLAAVVDPTATYDTVVRADAQAATTLEFVSKAINELNAGGMRIPADTASVRERVLLVLCLTRMMQIEQQNAKLKTAITVAELLLDNIEDFAGEGHQ